MRPSRRDVWIGKSLGIVMLSVLGVLLAIATHADGSEEPWWLLIGLVVVGALAAAAYEGIGWALSRSIVHVRGWRQRHLWRTEEPRAGATGYRPAGALWTLLAYIAAMLGTWVLVGVIIGVGWSDSDQEFNAVVVQYSPLVLLVSLLAGGAAAVLAYRRLTSSRDRAIALGWLNGGRPGFAIGVAILGVIAAWSYTVTIPRLVELQTDTPSVLWQVLSRSAGAGLILALLTMLAIAPVIEELVFRGIILDGFMRRWSEFLSVLVVTFLFVLLHAPDVLNYWPAAAMIAALGAGAAYVRLRSGAIGPSIALHAGYNLGVVTVWFL